MVERGNRAVIWLRLKTEKKKITELVKKTKEDGRELTNKGLYLLNQTAKKLKNESGRNKKEKTERVAKEKPTPDKSRGARKSPARTTKEKPAKQVPDKGSDRKAGKSKTSTPSTG